MESWVRNLSQWRQVGRFWHLAYLHTTGPISICTLWLLLNRASDCHISWLHWYWMCVQVFVCVGLCVVCVFFFFYTHNTDFVTNVFAPIVKIGIIDLSPIACCLFLIFRSAQKMHSSSSSPWETTCLNWLTDWWAYTRHMTAPSRWPWTPGSCLRTLWPGFEKCTMLTSQTFADISFYITFIKLIHAHDIIYKLCFLNKSFFYCLNISMFTESFLKDVSCVNSLLYALL